MKTCSTIFEETDYWNCKYISKDEIIKLCIKALEENHITATIINDEISKYKDIDHLFKAYESINDAISAIEQRMPYDFIEVDFKNIWDYLGYINGDTVREDLLDTIFSNFCIGK